MILGVLLSRDLPPGRLLQQVKNTLPGPMKKNNKCQQTQNTFKDFSIAIFKKSNKLIKRLNREIHDLIADRLLIGYERLMADRLYFLKYIAHSKILF